MTEQPLISIIIPVYNGETHLAQCLDSILAQTYQRWELLLIDDGSTDHTANLCNAYSEKDSRISVTHKKNEGAAAARNFGIAQAKGEWISFVDADDWLAPTMYETVVDTIHEDTDAIIWGYVEEYVNKQKVRVVAREPNTIDGTTALQRIIQDRIGSYFWSMLFRRTIVQEPILKIPCYEDHATIFKWIAHARTVTLLPITPYHYRQFHGSAIHADSSKQAFYYTAIKERYFFITQQHLLPSEGELRKEYLRGCIKFAKDVARDAQYSPQTKQILCEIRDDLRHFLPIRCNELGMKRFLRLRLLLCSVDAFVYILRFSTVFSSKKRKERHQLF